MTPTLHQKQRLRSRGICVIIPTYNNAGTIADVTTRAMEQCDDVIVVCDGCTDDTVNILESLPQRPSIVSLPRNCGKGTALKKGFQYALEQGFAYAITLDGDGQHFPEDIPALLEANIKHPGALIVGERKNLSTMERSGGSKFANSFSNFWFAIQTGHYLRDTQTGYRLYPLKKLHGLSFLTSRYEAELELMVFASWAGVDIFSEPVNVFYPSKQERVSHFRPGPDFTRIFILNTILCMLAVVYGYPRKLLRALLVGIRTFRALLIFVFGTLFYLNPKTFLTLHSPLSPKRRMRVIHKTIYRMSYFIQHIHGIPGTTYSQKNASGEDFAVPSVIICNHQSPLDLMPLLSLTPRMVVLTADWVWKSGFFGYPVRHAGFQPASAGIDTILPRLRELVAEGYSVAVYPEGTRSEDGSIGRFHKGAFMIARELELDIVPLVLYGMGKVLPKHGKRLHKWPIHLEVGQRVSQEEMAAHGTTLKEQASFMRAWYKENYARIADEFEQNV